MEDTRNLEQIYRSAVSGLYARLRSNYDFLVNKYGEQGLVLIADMSREYGMSIARRGLDKSVGNDLESVARYLLRIFKTVTYGKNPAELTEISPQRAVIKAFECPLHFTDPRMCQAHTTMERTVVEQLNPTLTYQIEKSVPKGDAFCEHVLLLKKSINGIN